MLLPQGTIERNTGITPNAASCVGVSAATRPARHATSSRIPGSKFRSSANPLPGRPAFGVAAPIHIGAPSTSAKVDGLNIGGQQRSRRVFHHHAPALHDHTAVRQETAQCARPAPPAAALAPLVQLRSVRKISPHHQRRQPHGRLVQQEHQGSAMSALPTASICCSPPERVAACWARRSSSRGNSSNTSRILSATGRPRRPP